MNTFKTTPDNRDPEATGGGGSASEAGGPGEGTGWRARRRTAARSRLLKKLGGKLAQVMRAGERVQFVTKGSMASGAERFFAGHAVAYHVNLRALVFTNERVILCHIGANGKPRALVSELAYASIRGLRSTWSGFCEVTLANGRTHRFSGVPRADRAYLREFLGRMMPVATVPPAALDAWSDGLVHLCPHCFTAVPGWPRACTHCGGGLKAATTAALLSFGWPGLGNWYLGHRWFAVFEMLGAVLFWLVFVVRPLRAELTTAYELPLGMGFWLPALTLVGVGHLLAAAVTFRFARKGHHPA